MLFQFIISILPLIHPTAPIRHDAMAIARAVSFAVETDKLPEGWSKEYTAAVMMVTAWEESNLSMSATGDGGKAFCAFQVHGPKSLEKNPVACARAALKIMREGAELCASHKLAPYIGGCSVKLAKRKSDYRLRLAESILEELDDEASVDYEYVD